MQYYSDPTIKDVMTELEVLQNQVDEIRTAGQRGLINKETIMQAIGWASLKQDIAEIKKEITAIANRIA